MNVIVMDREYQPLCVVDVYESLIWTERYDRYGDFELQLPVGITDLSFIQEDGYLRLLDSPYQMIVESIEITSQVDDASRVKVTGRSLESVLERRIVWNKTTLSGNFQNAIQRLLNENVISPSDNSRKIPGFRFKASTDPRITSLTIDAEYCGENLYDVIAGQCVEKSLGFRIFPMNDGGMEFSLYFGTDCSYNQENVPWVIFSPEFDNLFSSNYFRSKVDMKTVTMVYGKGFSTKDQAGQNVEHPVYISVASQYGALSGLDRREHYTNASSLSTTNESGETLTDAEYKKQLETKGTEDLAERTIIETSEGEIDATEQFVYGRDFDIGDVVQVENEFGAQFTARVSEVVRASDDEGDHVSATFTLIA